MHFLEYRLLAVAGEVQITLNGPAFNCDISNKKVNFFIVVARIEVLRTVLAAIDFEKDMLVEGLHVVVLQNVVSW